MAISLFMSPGHPRLWSFSQKVKREKSKVIIRGGSGREKSNSFRRRGHLKRKEPRKVDRSSYHLDEGESVVFTWFLGKF